MTILAWAFMLLVFPPQMTALAWAFMVLVFPPLLEHFEDSRRRNVKDMDRIIEENKELSDEDKGYD